MAKSKLTPVFRLIAREENGYHTLSCKIVYVDADGRIDSGSSWDPGPLDGFGFEVQADKEKHTFYGWEFKGLGFFPSYLKDPVTLDQAKRYVKVLTPLGKKVQKLNEQFGYPRDFADHLTRVAAALKVRLVIEQRLDKPGDDWNRDWSRLDSYRQYDIASAASRIRALEHQWAEQHEAKLSRS